MSESPAYAVRSDSGRTTAASPARNRHGRPPAQGGDTDSSARSRAVRLAVLPAALMALLAGATTGYVLLAQSGAADAATWGVLAGAAVLGCGVLVLAARAGAAYARRSARDGSTDARLIAEHHASALRRQVGQHLAEVQEMARRLASGEQVELPHFEEPVPPADVHDPVGRLAHDLTVSVWHTRAAIAQAAQNGTPSDSEERVEVFVNLARRLQSLVHRQINMLDNLENEVEDPELLKGLFQVDHLATRIRRHAENVAVLGGSVSRRQWTKPVKMMEVLRSSIAEVEHYSRVKLVPPLEGSLRGHAVADVIHLLAELVENATAFSDPSTQVLLRAQRVTAGIAVEVEDRGLGMSQEEQDRINALLANPDRIDISKLLADGRIGLYVVSALARRHGIVVRIQGNIYGGVQAILVLPVGLIGDDSPPAPHQAAHEAARPVHAAPQQPHAVQAAPEARYTPPPLDTAQPMTRTQLPQRPAQQPAAAPPQATYTPQRHYGAAPQPYVPQQHAPHSPSPHVPGPYDSDDRRSGRPALPQRRAQEHLAPELRDAPTARMSGGMPEGEHDPGLMAAFQRGVSLADAVSDEDPADHSR
ncbi:ATP-binding protein [Streptomyces sp. NPDC005551]|uniref:sensor histidine kinase n=1 Tax=unclassified Streptomyces TaxID=2593676 RepID=UPI0033CA267B